MTFPEYKPPDRSARFAASPLFARSPVELPHKVDETIAQIVPTVISETAAAAKASSVSLSPPPMHFCFGDKSRFEARTLLVPRQRDGSELVDDSEQKIKLCKEIKSRIFNRTSDNTGFSLESSYWDGAKEVFIEDTRLNVPSEDSVQLKKIFATGFAARIEALFSLAIACFDQYPAFLKQFSEKVPLLILENCTPGLQTNMGGGGWVAAHSAIVTGLDLTLNARFFSVKGKTTYFKSPSYISSPLREKMKELFGQYGWDATILEGEFNLSTAQQSGINKKFPCHSLLPAGSDLRLKLASTMEVPGYMNDYDALIEASCRDKVMEYLNQCFRGEITPETVVVLFEKDLKKFLTASVPLNSLKSEKLHHLTDQLKALTEALKDQESDFRTLLRHWQSIQFLINVIKSLAKENHKDVLQKNSNPLLTKLEKIITNVKADSKDLFSLSADHVASLKEKNSRANTREEFEDIMKEIEASLITDIDVKIKPPVPFYISATPQHLTEKEHCTRVVSSQLTTVSQERSGFMQKPGFEPDQGMLTKFRKDLLEFASVDYTAALEECDMQDSVVSFSMKLLEHFPIFLEGMKRLSPATDYKAIQEKLLFPKHKLTIELSEKAGVATT